MNWASKLSKKPGGKAGPGRGGFFVFSWSLLDDVWNKSKIHVLYRAIVWEWVWQLFIGLAVSSSRMHVVVFALNLCLALTCFLSKELSQLLHRVEYTWRGGWRRSIQLGILGFQWELRVRQGLKSSRRAICWSFLSLPLVHSHLSPHKEHSAPIPSPVVNRFNLRCRQFRCQVFLAPFDLTGQCVIVL